MVELSLKAEPFLGGFHQTYEGCVLEEVLNVSLMSISQPLGGRDVLARTLQAKWGCAYPEPGKSVESDDGKKRVLRLGEDSFLVMSVGNFPVKDMATHLGTAGYYTDQSDSWVILRLNGPLSLAALERICPIDLDPLAFPIGAFARTSMEHLGAIIVRADQNEFVLMSASSSAASFLHAITTSIRNVL